MKKIIMLKGIPGSGKSFRAKEMVDKHPGQYKRVNKDDLRAMIDNGKRSKGNEKQIIIIRNLIAGQYLGEGYNVIIDDTNFAPFHEKILREVAEEFNAEFEIKLFDTDLETCIERDSKRENPVGRKVIEEMYYKYLLPERKEKEERDLPYCIICDIDGTLAKKGDRDIYDNSKVYLDTVIKQTQLIINMLKADNRKIVITTGRMDVCKKETEQRLKDNEIPYDELYMRKTDDTRKDSVIKEEIYREHIEPKYNVFCVFDDRRHVIDMRRSLGLFVFDCNQTGISF